jgi:hypothetical protein
MKTRTLKIEAAGDFWRGRVVPKIRLTGKWLERAGFKPGCRVAIEMSGQGMMTLRFQPADNNRSPQPQSATLRTQGDLL